jgi:DUF1009 family protein
LGPGGWAASTAEKSISARVPRGGSELMCKRHPNRSHTRRIRSAFRVRKAIARPHIAQVDLFDQGRAVAEIPAQEQAFARRVEIGHGTQFAVETGAHLDLVVQQAARVGHDRRARPGGG